MTVTTQSAPLAATIETLRREAKALRAHADECRVARDRLGCSIETMSARRKISAEAMLADQDAAHLDRAANILANLNG